MQTLEKTDKRRAWKANYIVILIIIFSLFISYCLPLALAYGEPLQIAVLPFEINAEQNLDFLKNGIQDMLASRLSFKDQVRVIDKESVKKVAFSIKGFTGESFALLVGGKLKADFVIHGSLTIIGNSTSIDSKLIDISGKNPPVAFFKQSADPGGVIPAINQFATTINETIFNRNVDMMPKTIITPTPTTSNLITPSSMQQTPSSIQQTPSSIQNKSIISTVPQQLQTTQGQNINPEFSVNNNVKSKSSAWKSQIFKHLLNGIAVGDINKDNLMETVLISDHCVYIYKFINNRFVQITETSNNKLSTYIGVDVGDINKNGIDEIFVTCLNSEKNMPNSFVLEYDGNKYQKIVENSAWYFRIAETKVDGKILLGQKQKSDKDNISASPIYKMKWNGEKYVPSEKILESNKANVLGALIYDMIGDNTSQINTSQINTSQINTSQINTLQIIAYDKSEHLTLFNQNSGVIWRDVNRSGGNTNYFKLPKESPTDDPSFEYFSLPLRSADVNGDGNIEILYASNSDITGGYLSKFKRYNKGIIHCSFWNGTGLTLQWSTPEQPGRISDFIIGDFDNDGAKELILSNVIKDALSTFADSESLITVYKLIQ